MGIMNKLTTTLILLISVVITFSANGKLIDDNYDISSIKRIRLMGDVNVVLVVDTMAKGIIEYPDTVTDWGKNFFITLENETLTIQTIEGFVRGSDSVKCYSRPMIIKIASELREIENCYDSTLEVRGDLISPSLKVQTSGNGTIKIDNIKTDNAIFSILTGKGIIDIGNIFSDNLLCDVLGTGIINVESGSCKELICKTVGTGKMNLSGMQSRVVTIKYTGGGNIKCHAVDNLMLSGLGSTKIEYLGTPKIKSRGTVKPHKLHVEYNE